MPPRQDGEFPTREGIGSTYEVHEVQMATRPAPTPVREVLVNDVDGFFSQTTTRTPQEPTTGNTDAAGHLVLCMTAMETILVKLLEGFLMLRKKVE